MSRLMSVAFTEQAVRDHCKIVTRRKGWWTDKHGRRLLHAGDSLTLCRKVMGRKPGEPLERIAEVVVVDVRREQLVDLCADLGYARYEMILEGFPALAEGGIEGAAEFIDRYFKPQGIDPEDFVTRIEWRYLDGQRTLEGGSR